MENICEVEVSESKDPIVSESKACKIKPSTFKISLDIRSDGISPKKISTSIVKKLQFVNCLWWNKKKTYALKKVVVKVAIERDKNLEFRMTFSEIYTRKMYKKIQDIIIKFL